MNIAQLMARTDEVADLVRHGVVCCRAFVMHHSERLAGFGLYTSGQAAALCVIYDEEGHISAMQVTQTVHLFHVAITLISKPPHMIKMLTLLYVVGSIDVHDPQLDVT